MESTFLLRVHFDGSTTKLPLRWPARYVNAFLGVFREQQKMPCFHCKILTGGSGARSLSEVQQRFHTPELPRKSDSFHFRDGKKLAA